MSILRQSTARTVLVGPVLDSAGAAKTDEVVGSIKVTKNGTVGAANGSTTLTHDHAGKYKLAMATGDTDTVGVLEISLNSGTNDMPVARFNVVEEAVFDAYFAASATMPVTLAPDSINASVFDETTAFPLKSADTGSTAVARTGADSDTLKTLSDQLDAKASQTSVDDLPTNSELATALAAADDAVLAAISALNNLSSAGAQAAAAAALTAYQAAKTSDIPSAATVASQVRTELTTELARVDVATSSRLAAADYTAPANSDVAAIKAKTDNLPVDPADASDIAAAIAGLASTLSTIQGYVDELETRLTNARAGYLDKLNVSGTLAHSDAAATYKADVSLVALESTAQALKVVIDKLATMLEADGGVYRYTTNALEQAPVDTGEGNEELVAAVAALGEDIDALTSSCDTLYARINEDVPEGPINVIPAPETGMQTVAWGICYDQYGQVEEGVTVHIRVQSGGAAPAFYDSRVARGVSTASGLVAVIIPRDDSLVFEVKRGNGEWVEFAGADEEQIELPALIGTP